MSDHKEKKELVDPQIRKIHEKIKSNIDLIPVQNWGFEKNVSERLKDTKHGVVNQTLTKAEKHKLKKKEKQQIARGVGTLPKKVSEVIDWAASTSLANKNKPKPVEKLQKQPKSNQNLTNGSQNQRKPTPAEEAKAREIEEILRKKGVGKRKMKSQKVNAVEKSVPKENEVKKIQTDQKSAKKPEKKVKLIEKSSKNELNSDLSESSDQSNVDELDEEVGGYEDDNEEMASVEDESESDDLEDEEDENMEDSDLKYRKKELAAESGGYEDDNEDLDESEDDDEEIKAIHPKKKPKIELKQEVLEQKPPKSKKPKPEIELDDNQVAYNNLNYIVEDKKKPTKKEKRDKFTGRDYKRLLEKAEKREEKLGKIREKNPEKAAKIEEEIHWNKVIKRAEGVKVKDDPELLKKGLKRKLQQKQRSKKKWADRKSNVEKQKVKKQEKRKENITKRKEQKLKKKQQKARKKGRIA